MGGTMNDDENDVLVPMSRDEAYSKLMGLFKWAHESDGQETKRFVGETLHACGKALYPTRAAASKKLRCAPASYHNWTYGSYLPRLSTASRERWFEFFATDPVLPRVANILRASTDRMLQPQSTLPTIPSVPQVPSAEGLGVYLQLVVDEDAEGKLSELLRFLQDAKGWQIRKISYVRGS